MMTTLARRVHNFGAGPAVFPFAALEPVRAQLIDHARTRGFCSAPATTGRAPAGSSLDESELFCARVSIPCAVRAWGRRPSTFAEGRDVATLGNEMVEALYLAEARRVLARARP